jgi:hypothetical protein
VLIVHAAEPATAPFPVRLSYSAAGLARCLLNVKNSVSKLRKPYQDDFMTPGISPFSANPRKHKRQMPNFRKNARGRPHRLQRLCWREENFGFLLSFTRFAVVAILLPIVSGSVLQFRSSSPYPRSEALSRPERQAQTAQ